MRTRTCRYCPVEIFFATTEKGRSIPLEAKLQDVTLFVMADDPSRRDPSEPRVKAVRVRGYRPHHQTCAGVDQARADAKARRSRG